MVTNCKRSKTLFCYERFVKAVFSFVFWLTEKWSNQLLQILIVSKVKGSEMQYPALSSAFRAEK